MGNLLYVVAVILIIAWAIGYISVGTEASYTFFLLLQLLQ